MTNSQYKLSEGFFLTSAASKQGGKGNKGFVQRQDSPFSARILSLTIQSAVTACINLDNAPQLNPSDKGGVYESQDAGLNGDMNFGGSRCEGYSHFVECVQPRNKQFALRCCNDKEDCLVPNDNRESLTRVLGLLLTRRQRNAVTS